MKKSIEKALEGSQRQCEFPLRVIVSFLFFFTLEFKSQIAHDDDELHKNFCISLQLDEEEEEKKRFSEAIIVER